MQAPDKLPCLFCVNVSVDGVSQVHLRDPHIMLRGQAVGTEDGLAFKEGIPVWRGIDHMVDPWKGNPYTSRLNLHQNNGWLGNKPQDMPHDVSRHVVMAHVSAIPRKGIPALVARHLLLRIDHSVKPLVQIAACTVDSHASLCLELTPVLD